MLIDCFSGTVRGNRTLLKRAEVVNFDSHSFVCIIKKWADINAVFTMNIFLTTFFVVSFTFVLAFFYRT